MDNASLPFRRGGRFCFIPGVSRKIQGSKMNKNSQDLPPRFPKDKNEILRDFTLAGHLKNIRDTAQMKERLAPKWWEAAVGIFQFAAALGLLASIVQYPHLRALPEGRLLIFWMTAMILSLIMGFEFMILRLHHLRCAYDINVRLIEELNRRLKSLESAGGKSSENHSGAPARQDPPAGQ